MNISNSLSDGLRQFDVFWQAVLFKELYLQLSAKVCILYGFRMETFGNVRLFYNSIYKNCILKIHGYEIKYKIFDNLNIVNTSGENGHKNLQGAF